MDPRVKVTAAALQAAVDFSLENGATLGEVWRNSREIDTLRSAINAQLKELPQNDPARKPLESLKARTEPWVSGEAEDSLNLTAINEVLADILGDVGGTDRAPTAAQREVAASCAKRAALVASQWQKLRTQELEALNKQLRQAGHKEIVIPPPDKLGEGTAEESVELP
jgi:hypothetical protein